MAHINPSPVQNGTYAGVPTVGSDAVQYVSTLGNDANSGTSWGASNAKATIAAALAALPAGGGTVEVGAGTFTTASTIQPPVGVTIRGRGRNATVVQCSGAGAVIEVGAGANYVSVEHCTIKTSSAAGTARGVQIDDSTNRSVFHNVVITANAKVAGQIGYLILPAGGGAYYHCLSDADIMNYDVGVKLDTTGGSTNANANRLVGVNVVNVNTCVLIDHGSENELVGITMNTFSAGIGLQLTANATSNTVIFQAEGGTTSQSYNIAAGGNSNMLIVRDNCPTVSVDLGTANWIVNNGASPSDPWVAEINVFGVPQAQSGWSGLSANAASLGGWVLASASAQNNSIDFNVVLSQGTWTIEFMTRTASSFGIFTVNLDGTSVGTFDAYSAATVENVVAQITGVNVVKAGKHTIRFIMATKNASSTNYQGQLIYARCRRTA